MSNQHTNIETDAGKTKTSLKAVKIFLPHRSVVNDISLIRQGFSSQVLPFLPHLYLLQIIYVAHSLHESPPSIRTLTGSKWLGVLFFF